MKVKICLKENRGCFLFRMMQTNLKVLGCIKLIHSQKGRDRKRQTEGGRNLGGRGLNIQIKILNNLFQENENCHFLEFVQKRANMKKFHVYKCNCNMSPFGKRDSKLMNCV